MTRAWLTPANMPGTRRCRAFAIPNSSEWDAALYGAVLELTRPYNWELSGDVTPDEAAEVFQDALLQMIAGDVCCAAEYWERVRGIAPNDLIRYFPLWEATGSVANDWSLYAAAAAAATGLTWGNAGIGDGRTAAGFDSSTSYVDIYSSALASIFNGDQGTVMVWARVSGAGVWADSAYRGIVWFYAAGDYVYIRKTPTENKVAFAYKSGAVTRGTEITVGPTTDIFTLVLSWDLAQDELKFYLNGAHVAETDMTGTAWSQTLGACVIGALSPSPVQVWDGDIAHVALWARTLSPEEILYLSEVV